MKSIKYLNMLLTVIAFCLCVITMSLLGFIPAANAKGNNQHFANVPVNPDGTITVKLAKSETMDVNIESCSSNAFYNAEPIEVKIKE